jgi:hypothetical protein
MTSEGYFDMRHLSSPGRESGDCPIKGCTATLGGAPSQWGELPYCPEHRIRIHARTRTFVYYNGADPASKRDAALRNVLFERQYFGQHVLGNAAKAESHRICYETSEDALTWNVFSALAKGGALPALVSQLSHMDVKSEPELYLWGLRVRCDDSSAPTQFPGLSSARRRFEKGITKFLTEPDIMLHVPGKVLVLVEAKFTSGNTIALAGTSHDLPGEKPKSREGIVQRYSPSALPSGSLLAASSAAPFYSQLFRNLVFAMQMADELGVRWGLVSLVSEKQFQLRESKVEFQDPSPFISELLPPGSHEQFQFHTWERLYADHVANTSALDALAEYMYNKSANGRRALAIQGVV